MKKIYMFGLVLFLCLFSLSSVFAFSGSGAGTVGDPYQITSISEWYELNATTGDYFILMNDISFNGDAYEPLLNFGSYLDGQGFTISDIYRNNAGTIGVIETTGGSYSFSNIIFDNISMHGGAEGGIFITYSSHDFTIDNMSLRNSQYVKLGSYDGIGSLFGKMYSGTGVINQLGLYNISTSAFRYSSIFIGRYTPQYGAQLTVNNSYLYGSYSTVSTGASNSGCLIGEYRGLASKTTIFENFVLSCNSNFAVQDFGYETGMVNNYYTDFFRENVTVSSIAVTVPTLSNYVQVGTQAELKNISLYGSDLDFVDVWGIDAGINDGLPYLLSEYAVSLPTPNITIDRNTTASITYGEVSQINGSGCPAELNCSLYKNDLLVSNPFADLLSVGNYTFVYNTSGNENYSSGTVSTTLEVLPDNTSLSIGKSTGDSISYETVSTITGSGCLAGLTCNLYKNDVLVSNPFADLLSVGNYTFVYNTSGNENYSSDSVSTTLEITKTNPTLSIGKSTGDSIYAPTTSLITGSSCPVQLSCGLYVNDSSETNPFTASVVGNYTFVYNTSGNENYSSDSVSTTLTILDEILDNEPPVLTGVSLYDNVTIYDTLSSFVFTIDENAECSFIFNGTNITLQDNFSAILGLNTYTFNTSIPFNTYALNMSCADTRNNTVYYSASNIILTERPPSFFDTDFTPDACPLDNESTDRLFYTLMLIVGFIGLFTAFAIDNGLIGVLCSAIILIIGLASIGCSIAIALLICILGFVGFALSLTRLSLTGK